MGFGMFWMVLPALRNLTLVYWRIFANKGRSVSGSVLLGGAEERQFCSLGRLPTLLHLLSGSVLKPPSSKRGVCTSCLFATSVKVGESC